MQTTLEAHMRIIAGLLTSLLFAAPALADHPAYHRQGPVVVVDAWNPGFRGAHRTGYMWVDGYYDVYGAWVPGYYQPVSYRPGHVWVPGYWSYGSYVAGYWRPVQRAGYVWSPGYYAGRTWVSGGWVTTSHRAPARVVTSNRRHVRPAPRPVTRVTPRPSSRPAPRGNTRPSSRSGRSSGHRGGVR